MQRTEEFMTNMEFGRRVGCHHTMASRMRNGKRVPSAAMLARIIQAFEFTPEELNRLWVDLTTAKDEEARATSFGCWLRSTVFKEEDSEAEAAA